MVVFGLSPISLGGSSSGPLPTRTGAIPCNVCVGLPERKPGGDALSRSVPGICAPIAPSLEAVSFAGATGFRVFAGALAIFARSAASCVGSWAGG